MEHDGEEGDDVEFQVRSKFRLKQFCNFSERILIRVAYKVMGNATKVPGGLNGVVRDLSLPILELRGSGGWYNAIRYVIPVT